MCTTMNTFAFALLAILTAARRGAADPAPVPNSAADATDAAPCRPIFRGRLSSCDAFAIATLAPPRRCVHVAARPPPPAGGDPTVCRDAPGWFDGTNGCAAYRKNSDYCAKYGHLVFPRARGKPTANASCCACGGGTHGPPLLRAGEHVRLRGFGTQDACEVLRIAEVVVDPFHYLVEVRKPCGPQRAKVVRDSRGRASYQHEHVHNVGDVMLVQSDDPAVISRRDRVELKKCRTGQAEQEFVLTDLGEEGGSDVVRIRHRLTGTDLALAMGSESMSINVTQVFDEGLFEGSGDFFRLTATDNNNGRSSNSYFGNGMFGEKEHSEVTLANRNGFTEQEFSMWQFRPVAEEGPDDGPAAAPADEHSDWLLRATQTIGIDYLEQLPPWHLLDVEREASKGDVKARFRELSRRFHPDKLVNAPEKKELYGRIFLLLQSAYEGLKGANEKEKEEFRMQAESSSQLFAHSQYVVELLPFHWTRIEEGTGDDGGEAGGKGGAGRYILNVASHLNSTLSDQDILEEETGPSVQLWVTFIYSARCGMSKTVVGMVDLAARHLERENIKVGAYGCGLYKEHPIPPDANDPTGVKSDPICAQFERTETPNVHVIVETLPGRRRNEDGIMVEVPPAAELVKENARFKYFYAAVPRGNTTQFHPHHFIDFATAGKRVWVNSHLVHKMTPSDFADPTFIGNTSIVAYFDGTGDGETDAEVVGSITNSLPGVARRFQADDVYVGVAHCGYGDEHMDEEDAESQKHVDCSKLGVSWLPDIKIYGVNDTEGISLLRGHFGDTRDVQIALESAGNVLRMMLGGTDDDFEDDFEEMEDDENEEGEAGGSCNSQQPPPPPPPDYDLDLDEIDGRMEETPLLEAGADDEADETPPALETEPKPALEQGVDKEVPKKPKLASASDRPQLSGGRERMVKDKVSGFHQRETKRAGRGQILGGGSGGSGGFIT